MNTYFQFYETTHDGWLAERIDLETLTLIIQNDENMDQYVCSLNLELEWNKLYDLDNQTELDEFKPWKIHKVTGTITNNQLTIKLIDEDE